MQEFSSFDKIKIDLKRVVSLAELVAGCQKENVYISEVSFYLNGFIVMFEDFEGDAILHDYSKGDEYGLWETMGFPWDEGDVSVHDTDELCTLLGRLKRGEQRKNDN